MATPSGVFLVAGRHGEGPVRRGSRPRPRTAARSRTARSAPSLPPSTAWWSWALPSAAGPNRPQHYDTVDHQYDLIRHLATPGRSLDSYRGTDLPCHALGRILGVLDPVVGSPAGPKRRLTMTACLLLIVMAGATLVVATLAAWMLREHLVARKCRNTVGVPRSRKSKVEGQLWPRSR